MTTTEIILATSPLIVESKLTLTPDEVAKVLAAIRERTIEEGDCLLWTGGCSRGTGSNRPQPALWIGGKVQPLRRLAYVAYGKELLVHRRVSTTCGNDKCLCEDHLKEKSHSESLVGHRKSPVTVARIAAAKQAAGVLDWEKVRAIRASEKSNVELGREYSVHHETISKVRAHKMWRETSNPFNGLGARS